MFCPKCGRQLPDGAKFCDRCGHAFAAAPKEPSPAPEHQAPGPQPQQPAPEPKIFNFAASGGAGEAVLGSIGGAATAAAAQAVPGLGRVIGGGFRSFFKSVGSFFKEPKKMIPVFALAGVWLILNILQACGIDPIPTKILSFLTFAKGGTSGGFIGALGGVLGKGLFAGAVVSLIGLFTRGKGGEKRSFGQTFKGAFGVSLDTLWVYLCGIGAAMLVYLFISGGATRVSFMGGAAASFLAARAAMGNGFLKRLVSSITSKGKEKAGPGAAGFIRGLSVGFAAAALIGLSNVNLILIITGSLLTVGGAVMTILQATGVVKIGKGAAQS